MNGRNDSISADADGDAHTRIRVFIVTYKREHSLNENLRTLWEGAEDPELLDVLVLSNHPEVAIDEVNQRDNLRVIVNTTRPEGARGYLARDWNFGILDAFGDWTNARETLWCVLAQNDVTWVQGWDRALRNEDRFDLISQPTGDQAIALNIDAIRRIGFFDECFSVISCQEHDFLTRAALTLRERASINDDHGGDLLAPSWNPIGELFTVATNSLEVVNDDAPNQSFFGEELVGLASSKWEITTGELFYDRARVLSSQMYKMRVPPEVNWYPHFWIGANPSDQPLFLPAYISISAGTGSSSRFLRTLSHAYVALGPKGQRLVAKLPGLNRIRGRLIERESRRRHGQ